jgi:N4-gp56 family major capsid protein
MATALAPTVFSFPAGETGSVDKMLKQFWERTALETRVPNLVFSELVDRSGSHCWKRIPAREGDVINFWKLPLLDAKTTALVEISADGAGQAISAAQVQATCAEYGDYIMSSDIVDVVALADPREAFGKALMFQALRTFDTLLRLQCHSGGTKKYKDMSSTATAASTIAATDVLTRSMLLGIAFKDNYIPPAEDGFYTYISHHRPIKDLRADTSTGGWLDATKYSPNDDEKAWLQQAYVGRCENFLIFETPEVSSLTSGASSAKVYYNVAGGYEGIGAINLSGEHTPEPPKKGTGAQKGRPKKYGGYNIHLIHKPVGSSGIADPLDRRWTLGWKFNTVCKVLDPNAILVHEVGSDA